MDKNGSGKDQRQINFRINRKRFFTRLSVGVASIEIVFDEVSDMHDTSRITLGALNGGNEKHSVQHMHMGERLN